MIIASARLQYYRSYSDSAFEFEPHVNIIVGPNASGKTNLLDAVHYAAVGAPMRLTRGNIINNESDWARIDCLTNTNQQRVIKITGNKQEIYIDEKKHSKLPFDVVIPIVVFEPNHLYFITTSPDMRRQLLDDMLEKTDPEFSRLRNTYLRTLKQRNSLLKRPLVEVKKQVFAWDIRLSEIGGRYAEKRQKLIDDMNVTAPDIYSSIAGHNHKLQLKYETKVTGQYASTLLALLQNKLELDHMRGYTGYGPHRDDISILIDDYDMRDVASRGETRTILLSLKVIEATILESVTSKKPILLFDDVFGELDGTRRKRLTEYMKMNQTFITTTDGDLIEHQYSRHAHIIVFSEN